MAVVYDTYTYTADGGVTHPIRLSTNGALAQPTVASQSAPTSSISAEGGGSRRRLGLHPRGVRLKRTTGTGVARKTFSTFLPILLVADYNTLTKGAPLTVNGVAYTVSDKIGEKVR
jgi:hypothetical protein